VILCFGTFEKVKLYKARNLVEMTVRESQTCSNSASDPLATRKRFIAINITSSPTIVEYYHRTLTPEGTMIDVVVTQRVNAGDGGCI
jgi:hypothetical protein